jgi:RNA polymerase sigma factor (sigma-70 family)
VDLLPEQIGPRGSRRGRQLARHDARAVRALQGESSVLDPWIGGPRGRTHVSCASGERCAHHLAEIRSGPRASGGRRALLSITATLDRFRGESRFTTWAYAFVIFEVSKKLGRHFWRRPSVSLDAEPWERLPDRFGFDAAEAAASRELLDALHRAIDEALTEHQRRVFAAIVLNGVPLDALVVELDTNRNAIYKTLFDARRKLRAALVAEGHLNQEANQR